MPKRIPIKVGQEIFPTKTKAKDFIRAIAAKYEDGVQLGLEDEAFMRDLLALHPHSEEKIGAGVSHFTLGPDQKWGTTRNFIVHRIDRTFSDFSFHHCVDEGQSSPEPVPGFAECRGGPGCDFQNPGLLRPGRSFLRLPQKGSLQIKFPR